MGAVLISVALLGYFAASVLYVAGLYDRQWEKWANIGMLAGFASQTAWLIGVSWTTRAFPALTLYEWVAFFVWLTVGLYVIGWRRLFPRHVGGFLFPILFVVWLLSQTLSQRVGTVPASLTAPWLGVHIVLATAGYVAFLFSAVFGIMYIEKERELKEKRARLFYYQLPPLDLMDVYGARLIMVGVPLLAAAMVMGAVWAKTAWGSYWSWNAKELWSLITLAVYLGYLLARWFGGWRGHRAAVLAMSAFLLVLVNIFAVNLLFHGVHDYNF
ncbi:MAG: cytochrome c biogenesis protein CcsA [Thermaerobacter sp.]|nr:cytochrome c biogenesis protein CcsA [Thermaerobacter sp.]